MARTIMRKQKFRRLGVDTLQLYQHQQRIVTIPCAKSTDEYKPFLQIDRIPRYGKPNQGTWWRTPGLVPAKLERRGSVRKHPCRCVNPWCDTQRVVLPARAYSCDLLINARPVELSVVGFYSVPEK